jgi:hypothetical protein
MTSKYWAVVTSGFPARSSWATSPSAISVTVAARDCTTGKEPVSATVDSARARQKSPTRTTMPLPNTSRAAGRPRRTRPSSTTSS